MQAGKAEGADGGASTGWTEGLGKDFWKRGLPLTGAPRMTPFLRAAAAVDHGATAASLAYALSVIPSIQRQGVERYVDRMAFYTEDKLLAHPERFFQPPPARVSVTERAVDPRRRDPEDAERVRIEFYSPFETVNPAFRERYQRYEPNERVESRAWFHKRGPRPAV
ncbi:MAG: hypothetical protein K8I02_10795, partial [Candidatus Methylomirabilis sp.]|nr:hypothetical protein [Deltaproteobacteria bacterium]